MDKSEVRTKLGLRNYELLTSIKGIKSLDSPEFSKLFYDAKSDKADFIALDDNLIIEIKEIINDQDDKLNTWLNERVKTDEFLRHSWFGTCSVGEIIRKHPDSEKFEAEVLNYIYRNIFKEVFRKSGKQIKKSKEILNKNRAYGMLSIVITTERAIIREGLVWALDKFLRNTPKYGDHIDLCMILTCESQYSFASSELSFYYNPNKADDYDNLDGLAKLIASYMREQHFLPEVY